MELNVISTKIMQCIDEENTLWCCKKFKDWGKQVDDDIYNVGYGIPPVVFNWHESQFQTTEDSFLMGCGGFGDLLQGEHIKSCPFCGEDLTKMVIKVNGETVSSVKKL